MSDDACVICMRPDIHSVLTVRGEPDWHAEVLKTLGMSPEAVSESLEADDGIGRFERRYQVCTQCLSKAELPAPLVGRPDLDGPVLEEPV